MTPSRIFASLTLVGDIFDPEYVTRKLRCAPTYVRRKGERIHQTDQIFDHTEWGIELPENESISFDEVMTQLINGIPATTQEMYDLAKELQAEWNIVFSYYIDYDFPFIGIEDDFLQYAAAIHATIAFDHYPNVLYADEKDIGNDQSWES